MKKLPKHVHGYMDRLGTARQLLGQVVEFQLDVDRAEPVVVRRLDPESVGKRGPNS